MRRHHPSHLHLSANNPPPPTTYSLPSTHLPKLRLLIRPLDRLTISQPILRIELHRNVMIIRTAIQPTTLDARHIRHDLQLGVQARAAGRAEPVLVDLAGRAFCVVVFGAAFGDLEGVARDDDVGGVGCACPLLAVGAVAEGRGGGLAWDGAVRVCWRWG